MKKEFIKLAGTLCIITLVAALLLAYVNKITEPRIIASAQAASESAMKTLISDAETFEKISEEVSKGVKGSEIVGYCVSVSADGFGGEIEMMVGIDCNNVVKGIEILSHSETAGLGAKAAQPDFKNRFKDTENYNDVQAITGATITSNAVKKGIDEAFAVLEEVKEGA